MYDTNVYTGAEATFNLVASNWQDLWHSLAELQAFANICKALFFFFFLTTLQKVKLHTCKMHTCKCFTPSYHTIDGTFSKAFRRKKDFFLTRPFAEEIFAGCLTQKDFWYLMYICNKKRIKDNSKGVVPAQWKAMGLRQFILPRDGLKYQMQANKCLLLVKVHPIGGRVLVIAGSLRPGNNLTFSTPRFKSHLNQILRICDTQI